MQHRRHVAHLVEEQRAAAGLLEAPRPGGHRAGEGALHVAEQLGLEQGLGERAAVDGHERAARPGRAPVQLAGDQLLAGAGLADDQHRDVGGGDLLDLPVHLLHPGAAPEDVAEALLLQPLAEAAVVGAQLVEQQRVLHQERGLGGEDGQGVEPAPVEVGAQPVAAHVDQPEGPSPVHQRHAEDRGELEVHHRGAGRELRVGAWRRRPGAARPCAAPGPPPCPRAARGPGRDSRGSRCAPPGRSAARPPPAPGSPGRRG